MSGINEGYPIEIVKFNAKTKAFDLNIQPLKEILEQDELKDVNITVISINGPARKGKSFILNFFLRYLHETYTKNNSNWLQNEDIPLNGFAWRSGSRRHTTGIWIWSKIFTKTLANGENVGIILMDTQGIYDGVSRINESNTIFYLTSMLSSVNILNLSSNINDADLENLKVFIEYGKLIEDNLNEKAFQSLLFLIRDWNYPYESEYGFNGGNSFLNKTLKTTEDMDEETIFIRENLKKCCERVQCFLMSPPGRSAISSATFKGELKFLNDDFKNNLRSLIPEILSPERIICKKINKDPIKGKHFISYFQYYWAMFRRGNEQTAENLYLVTTKAYFYNLKRETVENYQREMQKETADTNKSVPFTEMIRLHETNVGHVLNTFISKITFGDEKSRTEVIEKIKIELQDIFLLYAAANDTKQTNNFSQTMINLTEYATSLENKTLEQSTLMETLKQNIELVLKSTEEEKNQLLEEIERLRQNPLVVHEIIERGSTTESIEKEVSRFNDKVDKELRRFGERLRGDHDSIEDNLKEISSELGEKISKEGKRFGSSVSKEFKRAKEKCLIM